MITTSSTYNILTLAWNDTYFYINLRILPKFFLYQSFLKYSTLGMKLNKELQAKEVLMFYKSWAIYRYKIEKKVFLLYRY